jgi:hypothetical protein
MLFFLENNLDGKRYSVLTENDWVSYLARANLFNLIINQQRPIESIVKYTPKNGKIIEIDCGSRFTSILLE